MEQAHNNPGFDLKSRRPGEPSIRKEVKARIAGAETFTITRIEVLTALNTEHDHRVAVAVAVVAVSLDGPAHDQVC